MTDPALATDVELAVPCAYCRAEIPAGTFTYWPASTRLLSALCPDCDRRVTLAASTWRRWIRIPGQVAP